MSFIETAQTMGLVDVGNNGFHYADQYSEVLYRELKTTGVEENVDMMSSIPIPNIGLFTRKISTDSWKFHGVLSDKYKFEGNSSIISSIRNAINDAGTSIVTENTVMNCELTQIRSSLVLQNPQDIGEIGDVYPQVTIENSYNGSAAKRVLFGIHVMQSSRLGHAFSFNFKSFGNMRQIHHQAHDTTMSSPIGNYVQSFGSDIVDIFRMSCEKQLNEGDVMSVLDNIEKIGTSPRKAISTLVSEDSNGQFQSVSAWNMFLAIVKYSNFTTSLNTVRLLENVAERVLVIPSRMFEATGSAS